MKPTTSTSRTFITIEELPSGLRRAIKIHIPKAEAEKYHTKEGAENACLEASSDFMQTLEECGFSKSNYFLREYIFDPVNKQERDKARKDAFLALFPFDVGKNNNGQYCGFHFVVKVGDLIIDWSARQFDEVAPFPAIWLEA